MRKSVQIFLLPCTQSHCRGITSKWVAVGGNNSKYQKEPSLSLRSLPEFAVLVDKKYFASKCGKAVAKSKTGIYEVSSDSSQQYSNTDIVHRACERNLFPVNVHASRVFGKKGMAYRSQLIFLNQMNICRPFFSQHIQL